MPELKLKQLHHESDMWKRMLGFIQDENIHLKNRISEVLSNGFNKNMLEEIEIFQSRFIKEDEKISLLRNEIAELDNLLMREVFENGIIKKDIERKLRHLRKILRNTEDEFAKLKQEFNTYLAENI